MGLLLNFLLFALVFLLEGLVYLENLCYTVLWPSRRYRQHPRTTTLDKLILQKEDEIWHAAIYGKDGDVQKIFEDLTNRPGENGTSANISSECGAGFLPSNPGVPFASGKIEEGFLFHRPKIKLQAAIETNVAKTEFFNRGQGYETAVQARLENIADQLANSTRVLTEKESWKTIVWCHDPLPILWVAIKRCHWSDVDYLLTKRNLDLRMRYTFDKRTVLHEAVWCGNPVLVRDILKKSPSSSPKTYINVGDNTSETALHLLVYHSVYSVRNLDDLDKVLNMFTLLVENGADINALDESFMTPLHLLLSTVTRRSEYDHFLIPLLDSFILAGAEVNTKDIKGNSPLHLACKLRDYKAIEMLVRNGADTETLNRDGKSPRRVFTDCRVQDKDFWKRMTILSLQKQNISANLFAPSRKLPLSRSQNSKAEMALCDQSLIYCRYQRRGLVTKSSNPLHWSSTDKSVSDVLYSKNRPRDITFLAECEKECRYVWDEILEPSKVLDLNEQELEQRPTAGKFTSDKSRITLGEDLWRWVNFPANNITWVREFIEGNLDIDNITLKFLEKNLKACTTRNNTSRITEPHAHMMDKDAPKLSSHDRDKNSQTRSVVSLVIPFLDIEVTPAYPFTEISGDEAYSPFTGLDGVQMPETLDQTSIRAESQSKLRTKENQVIYRWSQKQNSAKIDQHPRNLEWRVHKPYSKLANLLRRIRRRIEIDDQEKAGDSSLGRMGQAGGSETADISTRARSILGDRRPKWLMVRQLWLWKLDDGTILTAIPSRENMCMADDLLETIQQSGLHEISDVDQLMKHILQETVAFPEKFKRAGLGEHILDVFESEIASEADEEATFYNNFAQNDWNSKHANKAISCTWRVKDIRDELQLIRNVFTSQLEVVNQFARGLASQLAQGPEDSDFIPRLRSKLGSMIQRIDSMDSEAAKTIESLNNITQAMLAQAALKEAESARLMNFIILPFTIVTVIFTPLSFMTSLFAVNSDGFPHNEDGELRIPSDWFWRRMVIGEFGTLIPLFIFVLFLYYWRRSPRSLSQEQPGR